MKKNQRLENIVLIFTSLSPQIDEANEEEPMLTDDALGTT